MATVYLTRHLHFNAAHRLHSKQLSEKENEKVYGSCNNPAGHGHNYELEVTVRGTPDPVTGMVMDLKELKDIVNREIIDKVDHKHLNHDVKFFENIVPTSENMVVVFWKILAKKITKAELFELKLYETPRNVVTFRGE